MLELKF